MRGPGFEFLWGTRSEREVSGTRSRCQQERTGEEVEERNFRFWLRKLRKFGDQNVKGCSQRTTHGDSK